jgi:protein-arginine kinase activator protein McsA
MENNIENCQVCDAKFDGRMKKIEERYDDKSIVVCGKCKKLTRETVDSMKKQDELKKEMREYVSNECDNCGYKRKSMSFDLVHYCKQCRIEYIGTPEMKADDERVINHFGFERISFK